MFQKKFYALIMVFCVTVNAATNSTTMATVSTNTTSGSNAYSSSSTVSVSDEAAVCSDLSGGCTVCSNLNQTSCQYKNQYCKWCNNTCYYNYNNYNGLSNMWTNGTCT